MYQDSPLLRLGRLDEIERTVKKPSHVLRSIIIKIQPEKVEAPRLKGGKRTKIIKEREHKAKALVHNFIQVYENASKQHDMRMSKIALRCSVRGSDKSTVTFRTLVASHIPGSLHIAGPRS